MTYFRELPNVQYQSFLSDKQSSHDYLLVKNIFRRAKIRDDLQNAVTIFNKYNIYFLAFDCLLDQIEKETQLYL